MKIIAASIDLSKIDKTKIQKLDKDGNPFKNGAMYYNVDIILSDQPNQFGQDTSLSTAQTKEERAEKAKRNYIGNGKTVWSDGGYKPNQASEVKETKQETRNGATSPNSDDMPF